MLSCRHLQIWKGIIACILQIYIANQGTPLTLCCKLVCPNCEVQHYANTDSFRHKQGASHYSGCTRSSILKKILLFREIFSVRTEAWRADSSGAAVGGWAQPFQTRRVSATLRWIQLRDLFLTSWIHDILHDIFQTWLWIWSFPGKRAKIHNILHEFMKNHEFRGEKKCLHLNSCRRFIYEFMENHEFIYEFMENHDFINEKNIWIWGTKKGLCMNS